jgi:hypothetical protein
MSPAKVCTKCGSLTVGGKKCAACGAAQLIPIDSPIARKIISETGQEQIAARAARQAAASTRRTWVIVAGAVVAFIVLAGILGNRDSNSAQSTAAASSPSAPPSPADISLTWAAAGAKQLQQSMRNPDSFKLNQVLIMGDGAACYDYRAQNGFGGMNVDQAVLSPTGKFKTTDSEGFAALWNRECANKTGDDKTWEVGYMAGLHGLFGK